MVRLIAGLTLLMLSTGCQTGALPGGTAMGARAPHVQLWGPPGDSGGSGNGGGGGGGNGM
ncbi:MAG TPA: hypothetical protein VMB73_12845 [Acetobacteraceae bacterium]|nr:hypothetical protein [Acetobacteraceae bacterium]